MAIISLASPRTAVRSTVALKALMAVSGLIMIGYLLAHMYGNLKLFAGADSFNDYAHHLRTLGEPILPHTGLLWILWVVLLVSVIAHAASAFRLWSMSRKARGGTKRYYSNKGRAGVQRTYSSFTTSPRCAPSPRRWMMYSTTLSSRAEGLLRPNNLSQKDLFSPCGMLLSSPRVSSHTEVYPLAGSPYRASRAELRLYNGSLRPRVDADE